MFCNVTIDFGGVNFPTPHKEDGIQYIGFVTVFSGCLRAAKGNPCPDCQNPSLWDFNSVQRYTLDDLKVFLQGKKRNFDSVFDVSRTQYFLALLGGEPLDQNPDELYGAWYQMVQVFGYNFFTVCFTGYPSLEAIPKAAVPFIRDTVDYLKLGPYLGNQYKREGLSSGLATENQYWVDFPFSE